MVPELHIGENVEMIRDGGSFAATFSDAAGHRYILLLQVHLDVEDGATSSAHHLVPIIIDCDPSGRAAGISELYGPRVEISWEHARGLLRDFAARKPADDAPGRGLFFDNWLQEMIDVARRDGAPAKQADYSW